MIAALPFPDVGPDLFRIEIGTFTLAIRYYALAYIVGLLAGWRLVAMALRRTRLWRDETPPMTTEQLESLVTWIIVGVIIGGRLGYAFGYKPAEFLADPMRVFRVWEGGMAFHGGFLGVVVVTLVFCIRHRLPLGQVSDLMALAAPPGLLLGRLANFINAELWGRPTDLPWGVAFPGAEAQNCPGVEGICARHPSQLYEAGLEGLLLGALLIWLAFATRALMRPWLITGVFMAGYGLSRFLVEMVRQPDAHFVGPGNPLGYRFVYGDYGLTMGQALSLPMILVGIWLIWRARRT